MLRTLAIIALMMIAIHFVTSLTCHSEAPYQQSDPTASSAASSAAPVPEMGSAIYNEGASGVLPMNHSSFEAPAEFNSDITNLNHFYRSNPEVFHGKGHINVPNPSDWDAQARAMFSAVDNAPQGPINPYNHNQEGAPLI